MCGEKSYRSLQELSQKGSLNISATSNFWQSPNGRGSVTSLSLLSLLTPNCAACHAYIHTCIRIMYFNGLLCIWRCGIERIRTVSNHSRRTNTHRMLAQRFLCTSAHSKIYAHQHTRTHAGWRTCLSMLGRRFSCLPTGFVCGLKP